MTFSFGFIVLLFSFKNPEFWNPCNPPFIKHTLAYFRICRNIFDIFQTTKNINYAYETWFLWHKNSIINNQFNCHTQTTEVLSSCFLAWVMRHQTGIPYEGVKFWIKFNFVLLILSYNMVMGNNQEKCNTLFRRIYFIWYSSM